MRQDIFDGLDRYFNFIVSFLTGCKENFHVERLVGFKLFFHGFKTELLLIFFRYIYSVGDFSF